MKALLLSAALILSSGRAQAQTLPIHNTPAEQASMDLNMEVGAAIGAAVSAQITIGDKISHTATSQTRTFLMPMVAYLGAAAVMETYTFYGEPKGNGQVGWFKAEQVGYGLFGAGLGSVVGASVHHMLIHPEVTLPVDHGGISTVAIGGSF